MVGQAKLSLDELQTTIVEIEREREREDPRSIPRHSTGPLQHVPNRSSHHKVARWEGQAEHSSINPPPKEPEKKKKRRRRKRLNDLREKNKLSITDFREKIKLSNTKQNINNVYFIINFIAMMMMMIMKKKTKTKKKRLVDHVWSTGGGCGELNPALFIIITVTYDF